MSVFSVASRSFSGFFFLFFLCFFFGGLAGDFAAVDGVGNSSMGPPSMVIAGVCASRMTVAGGSTGRVVSVGGGVSLRTTVGCLAGLG